MKNNSELIFEKMRMPGLLGFVLTSVSPAVIVSSMLDLNKNKIDTDKDIPTLIITGVSIDDVFAITIFSIFLGIYSSNNINIGIQLLGIPISIFFRFSIWRYNFNSNGTIYFNNSTFRNYRNKSFLSVEK